MSSPAPSPSWQSVRYRGRWRNYDGSLRSGTFKATIVSRVTNPTDDNIFPRGLWEMGDLNIVDAELGGQSLDIRLPAQDDPDITPHGWWVELVVSPANADPETYVLFPPISLADDEEGINLVNVTLPQNLPEPPPVIIRGIANGYAGLDEDGDVIDAEGTKVLPGGGGGGPGDPLTSYEDQIETLADYPTSFPPSSHNQAISTVTGLQTILDGKQPAGSYATSADLGSAVTALGTEIDGKQPSGSYATTTQLTDGLATKQPSGSYATSSDLTTGLATKQATGDYATNTALTSGLAAKANTVHGHVIDDVDGLQEALDAASGGGGLTTYDTVSGLPDYPATFPPAAHNQAISTITGLQTELDGKQAVGSYATTMNLSDGLATKADSSHSHPATGISDSTTVGRSVMTAADAAAARTAIGAGTSNLAIGTTGSTAKAGNYAPTASDVGLGSVNNTADSAKPISTAQQAALDLKAPLASPAFTGTPTGITKAHVGLTNVDNTADSSKPVSTAQQAALDLKAPLASPTFTGTVSGVTKTHVGLANVDNTTDAAKPVSTAQQTALNLKANLASPAFTGTPTGITKAHVGLGSVDNTADTAKPVSTAQQTALDLKAPLASPTFTGTVAGVTKAHVGLSNVDNTADSAKPVSTAQQTAINGRLENASGTAMRLRGYGSSLPGSGNVTGDIFIQTP